MTSFTKTFTKPLLAAALASSALGAAGASAASAAELTYIDDNNVFVENVDGSARHALSSDGTAARPYALPTADQHGNLAAFQASAQTGQQEIVYWAGGAGAPVRHRMPRTPGDQTTSAPTSARMQPDGLAPILAYTFLAFGDPAQPRYGRVEPALPVPAGAEASIDYVDLTWYRERPVVARPEGVIYWTGNSRMMLSSNEPGTKLTFAEVSADGTRVLVRSRDASGGQRLALLSYAGDIPFGEVPSGCAVPIGPGFTRGALSRDGKTVAWDDAAGVHVAQAEPDRLDDTSTCVLSGARVVSGTARMPSFSEASTTAPPGGGGGPTPAGGGGGGTQATTPGTTTPATKTKTGKPTSKPFSITVPSSIKASALRRGTSVKAYAPSAGRITLTLRRSGRAVATGSAKTARAGTATVRLRAKGRRIAGKLKLTATFRPTSGRAATKTLTVRVK